VEASFYSAGVIIDKSIITIVRLQRQLDDLKLTAILFLFDSLPMSVLNCVRLALNDSSLHFVSMWIGLLLVGMKASQLVQGERIKEDLLNNQLKSIDKKMKLISPTVNSLTSNYHIHTDKGVGPLRSGMNYNHTLSPNCVSIESIQ
jgi:hypothetical protein